MLACVGLLRQSGKRWTWPQVWLMAFTALVVTDPWALLQAGFWLSFVAVGVLFATDSGAAHGELSAIHPNEAVRPARYRIAHAATGVAATLREQ
jgi:competence protein ComEC